MAALAAAAGPAALGLALLVSGAEPAGATALPIVVDGYAEEWTIGPLHTDPAGDGGSSGVDFRNLWVAEDDDWFFIRFDTTNEIPLQETTNLALYLDTDNNASTGVQVGGIGAEMRWQFGDCGSGCYHRGTFYGNPPPKTFYWYNVDLCIGPTTTGSEFEVAIARDALPDGVTPLFTGDVIRILLRDEAVGGDRIPDSGEFATYTFSNEGLPPVPPNTLLKDDPGHVRLMTWNVKSAGLIPDGLWDPARAASFRRILQAINPEIINFQEIYDHSPAQTRALIESWLPSGPGQNWYAFGNNDAITVTRYPFAGIWNLGANFAGLLSTQAALDRALLVINAHLPCCDDDAGRQQEADQIMSFVRDAITPGGAVTVDSLTAILITGDLNLVGLRRQLTTFLTGDIADEGTWGPDFAPDWDGTSFTDLVTLQTEVRMAYTYYSPPAAQGDNPAYPGRLDMHLYSDSVVGTGNHFIIFTPNMSPAELELHGLNADDSTIASDHLPHVTDVFGHDPIVGVEELTAPEARAQLLISPNPAGASATIRLAGGGDHGGLSVAVYDVLGRRMRELATEAGAASPVVVTWDGRDAGGQVAPPGVYFLVVTGNDEAGRPIRRAASVRLVR